MGMRADISVDMALAPVESDFHGQGYTQGYSCTQYADRCMNMRTDMCMDMLAYTF